MKARKYLHNLRGLEIAELKEVGYAYFLGLLFFSSSNTSTKEALTIPVGTATTPIPIREMNVPNNLPPKVLGKISSKPTPVNDDTDHQKDSVILEKA